MTGEYKFVVALPTSNDPPDAIVSTTDEIIGIQPPLVFRENLPTPYDFGAVGDGTTDDTLSLQAWLDAIAGGAGFGKTGTFMVSAELVIHGSTTIWGAGKGSFVIKTQPGVPQNFMLLRNENIVTDVNGRLDRNIFISGVCFQGDPLTSVTGTTEFVVFVGVDGLTLRDCLFQKRKHSLLDLSNINNLEVDNCEFFDYGIREYSGTPGLYNGGTAIFCLTPSFNVRITNNFIHLGAGGIWLPFALPTESLDCVCSGNIINDVCEFGITSPPDRCVINDNIIANVHKVDVSGHGMELFGTNYTVANNIVIFCDGACIVLFDPTGVSVTDNHLDRSNQKDAVIGGALTVIALGTAAGGGALPPSFLTIANNNIFNTDGHGASAIAFWRLSADPTFLMNNVTVHGNNLGPDFWTDNPIEFVGDEAAVRGANFMIRDNPGAGPNDWSTNAIVFLIPAGSSGTKHIGAVGFRPSWIQFQAVLPSPAGLMAASIGQNSWSTGWDITTQTLSAPRVFGSSTGICWASDGTKSFSADFSGRHSINIFDADGHPICAAGLIGLDDDGFDILILESIVGDINTGGTGYALGDTGTIAGGDGLAVYTVNGETAGVVTSVAITGGSGYTTAVGAVTTPTTGAGDGALTLDIFSGSPTTLPVVVTAVCHA